LADRDGNIARLVAKFNILVRFDNWVEGIAAIIERYFVQTTALLVSMGFSFVAFWKIYYAAT
jgi:hypothetical protein